MKNTPLIPPSHKTVEGVKYLLLALLATLFLVELGLSFGWKVKGDLVYMHYIAYLINEHGFVPYRDIFEPNMPGSYLFHMAIGRMFGYSDYALRIVNVAWLAATFVVTWFIMNSFGKVVALGSCLLFGLLYLGYGPYMSLQRDFIAILPMATALLLATQRQPNHSVNLIHFLHGVLFAFVTLIKPHLIIGLPAMIVYNCIHDTNGSKSIKKLIKPFIVGGLFALVGFLLTLIIPFLWLWRIGALESFWDIFSSYAPLYPQMSGDKKFRETSSHIMYVLYKYLDFKRLGTLSMASIFGLYLVLTRPIFVAIKKPLILLFLLSILYAASAGISGKLWSPHLMQYMYFASLGAAIILYSPPSSCANLYRPNILPLLVFIVAATPILQATFFRIVLNAKTPYELSLEVRQDEITAYLNAHLSPTDKVQPLCWDEGVIEAMLASKAILATPYIAELQFYHHVSTPYIQKLREDFITKLEREMPRFIVDVHTYEPISGLDTTYEFPELKAFIKKHYDKDYAGSDFDIFRRDDS
ncbi:hypothetical protein [Candidatus Thiosymbion oneisti]|uniref:hypothetical protein n=1 Tax=Candidatus Thiosymbion oneisti TaxID=589554 RepID=UPI00106041A8|nr:hypothetical protein [Candidatus Thiosymbion oneisti]